MSFELNGNYIETDDNGFLKNLDDWNPEVGEYLAQEEGLEMNEARWEVVNLLRDYYSRFNIAPMIKILVKEMNKQYGPEKGNSAYLYELFPAGPAVQASKISGLPKPTGCV